MSASSYRSGAKVKQTSDPAKPPADEVVQGIRRATRKHYSAEEEIRISPGVTAAVNRLYVDAL